MTENVDIDWDIYPDNMQLWRGPGIMQDSASTFQLIKVVI